MSFLKVETGMFEILARAQLPRPLRHIDRNHVTRIFRKISVTLLYCTGSPKNQEMP